jgi:hypothetical protein
VEEFWHGVWHGGVLRAVNSLQQFGSAPIPGVVFFTVHMRTGYRMQDLMGADKGMHIDVDLELVGWNRD